MESVGRINEAGDAATDGGSERLRDSLFMVAQLRIADDATAVDVRVRNLSPGGLMIELDRMVAPGVAVSLSLRGVGEVTGKVAWCTRGRVGIAFDAEIDPKRARKPVGGGQTTPDYAKPIVFTRPPRR